MPNVEDEFLAFAAHSRRHFLWENLRAFSFGQLYQGPNAPHDWRVFQGEMRTLSVVEGIIRL